MDITDYGLNEDPDYNNISDYIRAANNAGLYWIINNTDLRIQVVEVKLSPTKDFKNYVISNANLIEFAFYGAFETALNKWNINERLNR